MSPKKNGKPFLTYFQFDNLYLLYLVFLYTISKELAYRPYLGYIGVLVLI